MRIKPSKCFSKAFTLVELLVVIAIISILASMLLPALDNAIYQARLVTCTNQHKQFFLATQLYGADNNGIYPYPGDGHGTTNLTATIYSSQYYSAARGHEYFGIGLLWRLGYLEDRRVMVESFGNSSLQYWWKWAQQTDEEN
jgi:prepilin-type N-terminal cleavage/methylation domain-containing protein